MRNCGNDQRNIFNIYKKIKYLILILTLLTKNVSLIITINISISINITNIIYMLVIEKGRVL
ncbi:hypothetical protein F240042I4_63440 [Eisenbergiella tayi]